jgi:GAF domain-containing protein
LLPTILEKVFTHSEPDAVFTALMVALCQVLQCDRCFLYLRNPQTSQGKITHSWVSDSQRPNLLGSDWIEEIDIATKDPLMLLAFRTPEAVFVEDIETAGSDILNLTYEQEYFGHRALIHAPIYHEGQLFGILEPCVFETPRVWTDSDRAIIAEVQTRLAPLAAVYVNNTVR